MPFHYTCERCGCVFLGDSKPVPHRTFRFCSWACMHPPREPVIQNDGTALVPLCNGKMAIIDEADVPLVAGRMWKPGKNGHAVTNRGRKEAPGPCCIPMHQILCPVPDGFFVDHKDRNPLNNRRSNLRPATRSQNAANCAWRVAASGYRGVSKGGAHTWQAVIRKRNLGRYDSPEAAARAYDAAARESWGEFAILNFPVAKEGDA